ncbi:TPA: hypothetical protein ACGO2N_001875 [Streptococcus suis]
MPIATLKNNGGNLVAILVAILQKMHQKTPHGSNHEVLFCCIVAGS